MINYFISDVALKAVKNNNQVIQYLPKDLWDIILSKIQEKVSLIEFLPVEAIKDTIFLNKCIDSGFNGSVNIHSSFYIKMLSNNKDYNKIFLKKYEISINDINSDFIRLNKDIIESLRSEYEKNHILKTINNLPETNKIMSKKIKF